MKKIKFLLLALSAISLTAFIERSSMNHIDERMLVKQYQNDTVHVNASILQVMPSGSNSILVLNRGTNYNVKVGDSGIVLGNSNMKFIITEVYPVRSKAVFNPPVESSKVTTRQTVIYAHKKLKP